MSKNTLYLWAKNDPRYEVVHRKAPWRKYSEEYKYKAVQLVIVEGKSQRRAAEIMGCKYGPIVGNWVRDYKQKGTIGMRPPDEPIGTPLPENEKPLTSKASTVEEYVRELEAKNKKLETENKKLKFESDVAHAIAEVRSKKGSGLDTSMLSNSEKTAVIDMLRPQYQLKNLLEYLCMAPTSYAYCKQAQRRPDKYENERRTIIEIFVESDENYGYRRISLETNKDNDYIRISERIVRRIMREEGIAAKQVSKRTYSSYRGTVGKVAPNLLKRSFSAEAPLSKVVTDVTQFKVFGQQIYLSPLLDLYGGEVLSYSVTTSPTVEFVLSMFDEDTKNLLRGSGAVAHSDQGFQYQHISYQMLLEELGCTQSMSRKGNCLDNAAAESFFARLKTEFFYGRTFASLNDFYERLDRYIWWYNHKRIKTDLGGLSPVEFREAYWQKAA